MFEPKLTTSQKLKPGSVRLLCIANSKTKRWNAFASSIENFTVNSGQSFHVELVEWIELINADGDLRAIKSLDPASFENAPAIVRIESPGKDFEIIRGLLAAGVREIGGPDDLIKCDVEYEMGKIVEPRLVYFGLKRILNRLGAVAKEVKGLSMLADPDDIASMFDKNATSIRLIEAGISTPEVFDFLRQGTRSDRPVWPEGNWDFGGTREAVDDFFDELKSFGFSNFYSKLAYGSACCGILISRTSPNLETDSISTMVRIGESFFNTRKLQAVGENEVGHWIDFLVKQGVTIQKAISKSCIGGDNFDVRVVVINGQVEFTIFRASRYPVTGLHIGGYRVDWKRCRAAIPNRAWLDAMDACVEAAGLYDSHVVGVDLAFDRSYMNHYIIELNPFGDFFPGWSNEQGKSIHGVEIESYVDLAASR